MSLLADATVRVSLIVGLSLGAAWAFGRRSAALRHWVLAIGLTCGASTPLLQLALPAWRVGPALAPAVQPAQVSVATAFVVREGAGASKPTAAAQPTDGSGAGLPLATDVAVVWLAGAVVSLLVLAFGFVRVSRLASAARPVAAGSPLFALASEIAREVGVRRRVTLLQSTDPRLLVTFGAARPVIVLPAGAREWSADRARVVLRHELAHVARGDWLVQMLAETVRALHWFNPLVWIACTRLRADGERACDDVVLDAGIDAAEYASHLLALARQARRQAPGAVLAMARASSLEGRVRAMLNNRLSRRPLRDATRVATLVAFGVLTVPLAVAQGRFSTLSGTVQDQTRKLVPGVTLVLTNASTEAKYEVRTDRTGHFEFVGLPSGDYQLAVQQPGFKTLKDKVTVAGQDLARSIELQIGAVHETIRVSGAQAGPAVSDPEMQAKAEQSRRRAQEARRRAPTNCESDTGGNILPPLKLVDVRPAYPETVRAAGIAGVVTLDALIGTDGSVRDVTLVSSPHPELERAAADAVRQWTFSTTYLNCVPIEVPMRVTVSFGGQ